MDAAIIKAIVSGRLKAIDNEAEAERAVLIEALIKAALRVSADWIFLSRGKDVNVATNNTKNGCQSRGFYSLGLVCVSVNYGALINVLDRRRFGVCWLALWFVQIQWRALLL